jgi:hypothetical protein
MSQLETKSGVKTPNLKKLKKITAYENSNVKGGFPDVLSSHFWSATVSHLAMSSSTCTKKSFSFLYLVFDH